jgi:hypothetical protein
MTARRCVQVRWRVMPRTSICSCLIRGISVSVLYARASDTTRPLVLASPPAPPPLLAVSLASVSWFLRLSSSSCCSLWEGGGHCSVRGGWLDWLVTACDAILWLKAQRLWYGLFAPVLGCGDALSSLCAASQRSDASAALAAGTAGRCHQTCMPHAM